MSKARRVWTIIGAAFALIGALAIVLMPDMALEFLALGISITLTYYGAKFLIYYLTHAQHMVGGKWFLLIGLILFDMGVFAIAIYDQAKIITVIYVIGTHLVSGILSMIRVAGNKKDNNPGWKTDLVQGIASISQVILCIIFINSVTIISISYAIYTIYYATMMVISAFKKTAIVYVQ